MTLPQETALNSTHDAAPPVLIRGAIAADIDAIHQLVGDAARTTSVLPRTRDSIFEHLQSFVVAEQGSDLVGCGSLAVFTRTLAEIKSLVVSPALRGQGLGVRIVAGLVEQARTLGIRRVFALTDNVRFFARCGFREVSKASLPHKVWNECIRCPKFLNCEEDAVELWLAPEEIA